MSAHKNIANIVAGFLKTQCPPDHSIVVLHEGNKAFDTQKIWSNEEVNVEDVAVENFKIEKEFSQFHRLVTGHKPDGFFSSLNGGQGMGAGTDAADSRGNVLGLKDGTPPEHSFKKPWRLYDLQATFLKFPIPDIHHDVPVSFNPGEIFNINPYALPHCYSQLLSGFDRNCTYPSVWLKTPHRHRISPGPQEIPAR
jgi:hypothetical protein